MAGRRETSSVRGKFRGRHRRRRSRASLRRNDSAPWCLRHLIGGYKDELGKEPLRSKCYECVGKFNRWHMRWAWTSLFGVMLADLYVRMCSMGIWTDWRIL